VNSNPFFCPDESAVEKFDELIRELKKEGDSIGAKLTVIAENGCFQNHLVSFHHDVHFHAVQLPQNHRQFLHL